MQFNSLIPELGVFDIAKSLNFYTQVLPFIVEYQRPESSFAFLSLNGSQLMLEQLGGKTAASEQEFREGKWRTGNLEYPLGRGMSLSIKVDDLQFITGRLAAANYPLTMKEREKWYRRDTALEGERQILVMDPDGYLLRFQQYLGQKPVE
jgi:lactoylglutathione lyase